MPVPSASEPHLSMKRALMVDDPRIQKLEDYVQEHRIFQKFEALVGLLVLMRPEKPWEAMANAYDKALKANVSAHERLIDVLARVCGMKAPERSGDLMEELFLGESEVSAYLNSAGVRTAFQKILQTILTVLKCPRDFDEVFLKQLKETAQRKGE